MSAVVSRFVDVIVVTAPATRGEILTTQHVELRPVPQRELRGSYIDELDEVLGKAAKRNLRSGRILTTRMIESPRLISRGDTVKMIAGGPGIAIQVMGEALGAGVEGEQIDVRNLASGRKVRGIVEGPGLVRMP